MLFVSSVEGHLVSRYGTGTRSQNAELIGAKRDQETGELIWLPEEITTLSDEEARIYAREYQRHFNEGALVRRTSEEFSVWRKARTAANEKAAAEAAEKAKPAPAAAPPALPPEGTTPIMVLEPSSPPPS